MDPHAPHPFPIRRVDRTLAVERLTALWALNEAGLGGILHAFRSPFTGIVVGGLAVVFIALIAFFAERRSWAILRALMVVLIIKALASPHSPPPAYLAVAFQGLLGALVFSRIRNITLGALIVAPLSLLESAVQKLLVLTILFGQPLWEAVDAFIDYVLQRAGVLDASQSGHGAGWVVGAYLGVYLAAGFVIGWLAGRLPEAVRRASEELPPPRLNITESPAPVRQRRRLLLLLLLAGVLAAGFFLQPEGSAWQPLYILLRVLAILGLWYFLLAPWLMRLLRRFLRRREARYRREVDRSLALLPILRGLAAVAWKEASRYRGLRRLEAFLVRLVTYALLYEERE